MSRSSSAMRMRMTLSLPLLAVLGRGTQQRQVDVERRALTENALDADRAVVQLDQRRHDRKTKPQAAARRSGRAARVALEDPLLLVGRDARTVVDDRDARPAV